MSDVSAPGREHRGRARFRHNAEGGVTVLCPLGHLITAWRPGDGATWAGSELAAKETEGWIVRCDGALPHDGASVVESAPDGYVWAGQIKVGHRLLDYDHVGAVVTRVERGEGESDEAILVFFGDDPDEDPAKYNASAPVKVAITSPTHPPTSH